MYGVKQNSYLWTLFKKLEFKLQFPLYGVCVHTVLIFITRTDNISISYNSILCEAWLLISNVDNSRWGASWSEQQLFAAINYRHKCIDISNQPAH